MSLTWGLYLAEALGSIREIFMLSSAIIGFGVVLYVVFTGALCDEDNPVRWNIVRSLSYLAIALAVLGSLSPSSKTIYMIMGAKAAEQLASKAIDSKIPDKVLTLINQKLDEAIKPEKK